MCNLCFDVKIVHKQTGTVSGKKNYVQFDLKPVPIEPGDIAERLMNESMDNQAVLDRYL